MNRLAVLGASGHGKVVGDAALGSAWADIVYFDDRWPQLQEIGPRKVIGGSKELLQSRAAFDSVIVAIGDNRTRLTHQRALGAAGVPLATIVHPAATVSPYAEIGAGTVVFAGAVLNPFAVVGAASIINTGATVDHDCRLADGVHVGPGAHLGGAVRVGESSWVGIGAAVRNGVSIGAGVIVGAGAAVVSDVSDDITVAGVPARVLELGNRL